MKRFLLLLNLWLAIIVAAANAQETSTTRYVREGGTGTGLSWDDASADLQQMIDASAPGDQIWVAAGTYYPLHKAAEFGSDNNNTIPTTDRDNAFVLKEGVKIYGGFPDDGTPAFANRDWRTNTTILSADIGNTPENTNDNTYHVVIAVNIAEGTGTILDGFTITGGTADVNVEYITIDGRNIFRGSGGGIYNTFSSPILTNLIITGNKAESEGGGIFSYSSSPIVNNVTFTDNKGHFGGGMYNGNSSSSILTNVFFTRNEAGSDGGGIFNFSSSTLTLTNATLAGNTASGYIGGGIHNLNASLNLHNSIVYGNTSQVGTDGDNIGNEGDYTLDYTYSLVGGDYPDGTGNLDDSESAIDPLFTDPEAGDYTLQEKSPCVNTASNEAYRAAPRTNLNTDKDMAGKPRLYNNIIDMGAFECQTKPYVPPVTPPDPEYITLTIPTVEGITTDPEPGLNEIRFGSYVTLTITALENYSLDEVVVRANKWIILYPIPPAENDTTGTLSYNLGNLYADMVVSIEGVKYIAPPVSTQPIDNDTRLYVSEGILHIETLHPQPVNVYTITGVRITSRNVNGHVTIPLAPGIYAVNIGVRMEKIIVKD